MTKLGQLKKGQAAIVIAVAEGSEGNTNAGLLRRLAEMGLVVGSKVEVLHEAPFGGDPIAIRVRGTTLALRRSEANFVQVKMV